MRKKCFKKKSSSKHKKRYHTSVVECKENDIDSDIDNDNTINLDKDIDNKNVNTTLKAGPCFCGKNYLMMNEILLSKCDNPDSQKKNLTRSPNHYSKNEASYEILSIDEYKDCLVVSDDILQNKQKDFSLFFTRGRHEKIDVYYLSQHCFELPLIIRGNSNIFILFKQFTKTVQIFLMDIAAFDKSYEELKDLCREAWKQKYSYLKINRLDDQEKKCICNENKNEYKFFWTSVKPPFIKLVWFTFVRHPSSKSLTSIAFFHGLKLWSCFQLFVLDEVTLVC